MTAAHSMAYIMVGKVWEHNYSLIGRFCKSGSTWYEKNLSNLVLEIDQLDPELFVVGIFPQAFVELLRFQLSLGQPETFVAISRFSARALNVFGFVDVQF